MTTNEKAIITTKLNNLLANNINWVKINNITVFFDTFNISKYDVSFFRTPDRINPMFIYNRVATADIPINDVYRALL